MTTRSNWWHGAGPVGLCCLSLLVASGCGDDPVVERQGAQGEKRLERVEAPEVNPGGEAPGATGTSPSPTAPNTPALTEGERTRRALVQKLQERLRGTDDPDVQVETLAQAQELGAEARGMWAEIQKCTESDEPVVAAAAYRAAGLIGKGESKDLLEQGLRSDASEVREAAALAWGDAAIGDLRPVIKVAEEDLKARVQLAAMMTVEKNGQPVHVAEVVRVLPALDPLASRAAVRFLTEKGGGDQALVLAPLLERDDPELRQLAATALGKFGRKDKSVFQALSRGLVDEELAVREASHAALKSLTGQDFGYKADAKEEVRQNGRKLWQEWIDRN